MTAEIETTEHDEVTLEASNTESLRTVPGTERVIADFERGEPVVHKEASVVKSYSRPANLMHVNLVTETTERR